MEAKPTPTTNQAAIPVETVIFGGGIAGLWLLDELTQQGRSALLLESHSLGAGQTVASQGIIHGGLKYTLQGMLTRSAAQIREMPGIWKACLEGTQTPNLSQTPLRSNSCSLWRTESIRSRLGMIGAKVGLRVAPTSLDEESRPEVLRNCPGTVAQLAEQVLSPAGLIADLFRQHQSRILKIDSTAGIDFQLDETGAVTHIKLSSPTDGANLTLSSQQVVFSAGKGNIGLREACRLATNVGQVRPLHMVVVKGDLPQLNGHCVDGAKTRVTISSEREPSGKTVWQLGGQIAELGVKMSPQALLEFAVSELEQSIPGIELSQTEWSCYRVDRAEPITPEGKRPETAYYLHEHNIWTAWPTKLALAPQLSELLVPQLIEHSQSNVDHTKSVVDEPAIQNWPRPEVAQPPWETEAVWYRYESLKTDRQSKAA